MLRKKLLAHFVFVLMSLPVVVQASDEVLGFDLYSVEAQGVRQSTARVSMNTSLAPFKDHLLQFPFHKYRIKYASQIAVPVMKKQSMQLNADEVINLRLFYREKKRIGLWLQWLDGDGEELLNTRLHFNDHEPVIAGTDTGEYSGKLLLLRLREG